ncbi:hypothetical protein Mgra_00002117 [Meloidogyne graminicola]|uniref:G-protein coupled receptors family 1 profile domain-containing protein n=1 Tax=Meloidogyne graminicola TaxID=189291 RepID=A0A8S9ZZ88_9BILA|nr:hypothetical protein Mgra_00002117 [Meloidogyne graminicola]
MSSTNFFENNTNNNFYIKENINLLIIKSTTEGIIIYKKKKKKKKKIIFYETYNLARFLFVSIASIFAFFDSCICSVYILLFGVDAISFGIRIKTLFIFYHWYIIPAFVIARIAQLAIPYMLIFASLERLIWIEGKLNNCSIIQHLYSIKGRKITIIITLFICIILRLPTLWAITIHYYPNCKDFFRSLSAGPSDWVFKSQFYQFYDFHLLSVAQTVFPFFLLLTINLIVIRRVSKSNNNNNNSFNKTTKTLNKSFNLNKRKSSSFRINKLTFNGPVRSAVYTMVCIVCTYLISNSLHLILCILEKSNSLLLKDPTDPSLASTFHTVFSDAVSFVYMFTSAIRILIYYSCNQQIRIKIKNCLLFKNNKYNNNLNNTIIFNKEYKNTTTINNEIPKINEKINLPIYQIFIEDLTNNNKKINKKDKKLNLIWEMKTLKEEENNEEEEII